VEADRVALAADPDAYLDVYGARGTAGREP
jgi:hypothetical protein